MSNEKIHKFIECLVPVTICNLECEYCYVIQENRRKMKNPTWDYSVEHVAKALSKKRLGGMAYISICGAGETLVSDEVIELTYLLLKEGHAVNITTNGTLNKKFDEILKFPEEYLKRLHFAFSLHYIELKKKNKLDAFFDNIDKVRKVGCSFVLQLNLYDGYIPFIEEIKKICLDRTGALPQVALTRKEDFIHREMRFKMHTSQKEDEYIQIARSFDSQLFDCTLENFNVKRKEFCYAGAWSGVLNLQTGVMSPCYRMKGKNIFKDIEKPISFNAVGKCCPSRYCINSSHFMSLGVIPEADTVSYAELRNRPEANWYNETMKEILSHKLAESNDEYNWVKKCSASTISFIRKVENSCETVLGAVVKKLGIRGKD